MVSSFIRKVKNSRQFKGTKLLEHLAPGSSGPAGSTSSTRGESSSPTILNKAVKYLVEIENLGLDASLIEYDAKVFQIPFE